LEAESYEFAFWWGPAKFDGRTCSSTIWTSRSTTPDWIRSPLCTGGQQDSAIMAYREVTVADLKEAMDVVDPV